jgi:hypothetical protein
VHCSLFRTASPLLLDFNDPFNKDLLGHDEELIELAMGMRSGILWFRSAGYPKSVRKGHMYKKEIGEKLRGVLGPI